MGGSTGIMEKKMETTIDLDSYFSVQSSLTACSKSGLRISFPDLERGQVISLFKQTAKVMKH